MSISPDIMSTTATAGDNNKTSNNQNKSSSNNDNNINKEQTRAGNNCEPSMGQTSLLQIHCFSGNRKQYLRCCDSYVRLATVVLFLLFVSSCSNTMGVLILFRAAFSTASSLTLKVARDARMDPPTQVENFRSGGAVMRIFRFFGACFRTFFSSNSEAASKQGLLIRHECMYAQPYRTTPAKGIMLGRWGGGGQTPAPRNVTAVRRPECGVIPDRTIQCLRYYTLPYCTILRTIQHTIPDSIISYNTILYHAIPEQTQSHLTINPTPPGHTTLLSTGNNTIQQNKYNKINTEAVKK